MGFEENFVYLIAVFAVCEKAPFEGLAWLPTNPSPLPLDPTAAVRVEGENRSHTSLGQTFSAVVSDSQPPKSNRT